MSIRLKQYIEEDILLIRKSIYIYLQQLLIGTYSGIGYLLTWVYGVFEISGFALCDGIIYNTIRYIYSCHMEQKVQDAIAEIKSLRLAVCCNTLAYKTAQKLAEPHLGVLNNKSKEIALHHNRKPILITFIGFRAYEK